MSQHMQPPAGISKPVRTLPDACPGCDYSNMACAATRDIERRPCCGICDHGD